ncbi:MAG: hypothetical protein RL722_2558, partial [Pseudomonadota bacterium]
MATYISLENLVFTESDGVALLTIKVSGDPLSGGNHDLGYSLSDGIGAYAATLGA